MGAAPVIPRWRADAELSIDALREQENSMGERGTVSPPLKRPKLQPVQDGSTISSSSPASETIAVCRESCTARGDDELRRVLSQAPTWRSRPRLGNVGTIGDWLQAH